MHETAGSPTVRSEQHLEMLVGRDEELGTFGRLLANARTGTSGGVFLVGEPGMGKTALLDAVAANASSMAVVRVRGLESEADIPFGGLLELLRPMLGALDRTPEPQRAALSAALAIQAGRMPDRFAVGAATLSLIATHAEARPVLILVDDAQWLDSASAAALAFAGRRLVADPVAVIVAARATDALFAGLPVVELRGLDADSAAVLARGRAGDGLTAVALEQLYAVTLGNPLATLELAGDAETLALQPAGAVIPLPERLAAAFVSTAGHLSPDAREMVLLAAAIDRGELATLRRAAEHLGIDFAALAAAEAEGIVTIAGGTVDFFHPLARSALYAQAGPAERRRAHAALARALPDHEADRRAWHVAAAAFGPDADACRELRLAARRARDRSAHAVAAGAFTRAADFATEPVERLDLLVEAATSAWDGGFGSRAIELLDAADAIATADDAPARLRIARLRGRVLIGQGRLRAGHDTLTEAAEALAADHPTQAALMLAEATDALFYTGAVDDMLATGRRAHALGRDATAPQARFFGDVSYGMALILSGDGNAGATLIRDALTELTEPDSPISDPRLVALAVRAPQFLREARTGRTMIDRAVLTARDECRIGVLPYLLFHIARDQATTADWLGARATYGEAIRLARESSQPVELAASLAGSAVLKARLGLESECLEEAREAADLCDEYRLGFFGVWAEGALADLELGRGDPGAAVQHLERQNELIADLGIGDVDLAPAPELVAAYLQLRRPDDARAVAEPFVAMAREKGQPWSLARAERCLGLLAETGYDASFEAALEHGAHTPDRFEVARTRLAYGQRLRRDRRRREARAMLSAAVDEFDGLGATPWADRAAAELRATGESARRRTPASLNELTPQELQIALLLARGLTRREAAAALFVSPKTIEYHLRHVYNKLGIRTRDELTEALRLAPVAGEDPGRT